MVATSRLKKTVKNKSACQITFEIFGDRWTLRIINALGEKSLRFNELQEALDINSATLTVKLKKLKRLRLLTRERALDDKLSVTYTLTSTGRELLPLYDAILAFGKKFF